MTMDRGDKSGNVKKLVTALGCMEKVTYCQRKTAVAFCASCLQYQTIKNLVFWLLSYGVDS